MITAETPMETVAFAQAEWEALSLPQQQTLLAAAAGFPIAASRATSRRLERLDLIGADEFATEHGLHVVRWRP